MALNNKNNRCITGAISLVMAYLALPINSFAQNLPTTAEPTRIIKDKIKPAPLPQVEPQEPAKKIDPVEKAKKQQGPTFTLQEIQINGLNTVKWAEASNLFQHLLGSKISLTDAKNIADAITKLHRSKGYILTKAVLPEQEIDASGILTIKIIEGYIENVHLAGNAPTHNKQIMAYANKIKDSRPLHIDDLERYTLLINDMAGISAKATLSPVQAEEGDGSHIGASNLNLSFIRNNLGAYASFNNQGSKYMGPTQYETGIIFNSTNYIPGSTTIRGLATTDYNELHYFEVSQVNNIGDEGDTISFNVSKSNSEPGSILRDLEFENFSDQVTIQLTRPFIRSRSKNLRGTLTFNYTDSKIHSLGTELSHDRLSVLRAGATYDFADKYRGINLVQGEFSHGLHLFAPTDTDQNTSRPEGKPMFTKISGQASRLQNVKGDFNILVAAKGQYALEPLLSSEEFGFGGSSFGRGLDSSEITGDSGFATKFELQYGKEVDNNFVKNYQLYGFYDFGIAWNRDEDIILEEKKRTGATAGIGTRFQLPKNISGYVEFAKPLTRGRNADIDDAKLGKILFKIRGEL